MPDYHYAKYNTNAAPWALYRSEIVKVVIGSGVQTIGNYAFYECKALTEVVFAENVALTAINEGAFGYTSALKTITLPASLETIGKCGFYFSGLETVAFTEGSKMTAFGGDYIFRNCVNLTSVYIPENITSFGIAVFYQCGDQVVLIVTADSYALQYAQSRGYHYVIR
jgi:hypothetical protein